MRSKKGITLVSLVVTIIVLIILAGVSINLILGENGIITIAKRARENIELAKIDEETQLNELYTQIDHEGLSGGISYDAIAKLTEFKREIARAISDMGIETAENADVSTMSSNIRSIVGATSADKVNYDNSSSNITSTNVQGAVDELNNNLNNNLIVKTFVEDNIIIEPLNYYLKDYDIHIDGYTPICVRSWQIANASTEGKGASLCRNYGIPMSDNLCGFKILNTDSNIIAKIKIVFSVVYSKTPINVVS